MHTLTDAENAVAAFLRFRTETQEAGLRMDTPTIIQLMIAERLNVIASHLDDNGEKVEKSAAIRRSDRVVEVARARS
jgi:hypothetical protein